MPSRRDVFIDKGIYHVFNKTIDHRQLFSEGRLCVEFLRRIRYYISLKATLRYSHYKRLQPDEKKEYESNLYMQKYRSVDIISYCLMPNHFHLLIKQRTGGSLQKFVANVVNSFTRYFNLAHDRHGPIFLPQFESRRIVRDEQFIHTIRYIDLNPLTSDVVNSIDQLQFYPWSSYRSYINEETNEILSKKIFLDYIGHNINRYTEFVADQADYQRSLEWIKHAKDWK